MKQLTTIIWYPFSNETPIYVLNQILMLTSFDKYVSLNLKNHLNLKKYSLENVTEKLQNIQNLPALDKNYFPTSKTRFNGF